MIATSAVAIALATSAMADSNFSGGYVGGNVGYGAGKTKFDNNETAVANKFKADLGISGVIGGVLFKGAKFFDKPLRISFSLKTEGTKEMMGSTGQHGRALCSIKGRSMFFIGYQL